MTLRTFNRTKLDKCRWDEVLQRGSIFTIHALKDRDRISLGGKDPDLARPGSNARKADLD